MTAPMMEIFYHMQTHIHSHVRLQKSQYGPRIDLFSIHSHATFHILCDVNCVIYCTSIWYKLQGETL